MLGGKEQHNDGLDNTPNDCNELYVSVDIWLFRKNSYPWMDSLDILCHFVVVEDSP